MDVATRKTASELAADVVKFLTGFRMVDMEDRRDKVFAKATNGDITLWFNTSWHEGKLHVSGMYPSKPGLADERSCMRYDERAPSVNVGIERAPEKAAADINRRLIPAVKELTDKVREAVQRAENYRDNKKRIAKQLGDAVGVQVRGQDEAEIYFTFGGGYAVGKAGDASADLELHGIDPALAVKILKLLPAKQIG